jgi:hypothetical protein
VAGYSGRGRQNRRTNGRIQPDYSLGGYHTFLPTANTPIFVANVETILEHDSELFRSFVNTNVIVKDLLAYLLSSKLDNTIIFMIFFSQNLLYGYYVGRCTIQLIRNTVD